MKVSKETYNKLLNNSIDVKQNKYHNQKCVYKGIKFDSKKEMGEYIKLELLQESKVIHDLRLQVEFELISTFKLNDKTYRKTVYIADFTYFDKENKLHVIDVKSEATRKDKTYRLKKKLMAWKHGIEIEEI